MTHLRMDQHLHASISKYGTTTLQLAWVYNKLLSTRYDFDLDVAIQALTVDHRNLFSLSISFHINLLLASISKHVPR